MYNYTTLRKVMEKRVHNYRIVKTITSLYLIPFLYLAIYSILSPHFSDQTLRFASVFFGVLCFFFLLKIAYIGYQNTPPCSKYEKFLSMFLILTTLLIPFGDYVLIPVVFIVLISFLQKNFRNIFFAKPTLSESLWITFCLFCAISSFFIYPVDKISSIGMSVVFIFYIILYQVAKNIAIPKKTWNLIKTLFMWTFIISTSFALFHLFLDRPINIIGIQISSNGHPGLASIISPWPSNASGYLCISLCLLCAIFFHTVSHQEKKLAICGIAIALLAITETETRMALLFIFGMLLPFVILYPLQKFRYLRFTLLLIPFILAIFSIQTSKKWQDTIANPKAQTTIHNRLDQYKFALKLISSQNIWLGCGLMNFRNLYKQEKARQDNNSVSEEIQFIHNIYLAVLTETGIVGFILFISVFLSMIKVLWKHRSSFSAFFGLCFLSAIALVNLVDSWIFVLRFSILLFIIFGRIFYYIEESK